MMARTGRRCLQSFLKVANSVLGIVGIAMIMYSLWMVRVWQKDMEGSSSSDKFNVWFICAFLGTGIFLCLITCLGHIAADSGNACCLSCYMVIIFLLLLLETALTADILLNSDWEKDLPEDPTDRLDDFEHFVKSNVDTCKWIGLLFILIQGLSTLLALALRSVGENSESKYDSEDEYIPAKFPLINHHVQVQSPPYVVGNPQFISKTIA